MEWRIKELCNLRHCLRINMDKINVCRERIDFIYNIHVDNTNLNKHHFKNKEDMSMITDCIIINLMLNSLNKVIISIMISVKFTKKKKKKKITMLFSCSCKKLRICVFAVYID